MMALTLPKKFSSVGDFNEWLSSYMPKWTTFCEAAATNPDDMERLLQEFSNLSLRDEPTTAKSSLVLQPEPEPEPEPLTFDTFHPFTRLPKELRDQIWNEAISVPKIVEIAWVVIMGKSEWTSIPTSTSASGLLRACHESREWYLKSNVPILRPLNTWYFWGKKMSPPKLMTSPITYLNPDIDTLYIRLDTSEEEIRTLWWPKYAELSALQSLENWEKVRHIACDITAVDLFFPDPDNNRRPGRYQFSEMKSICAISNDFHIENLADGALAVVNDPDVESAGGENVWDKRTIEIKEKHPQVNCPAVKIKRITRGGVGAWEKHDNA